MKIVSLFSGCGGLDLGFIKAGFEVIWANEYDRTIWETYEKNHRETVLDRRSICDIPSDEIPEADGIIGGPPCQSWSEAGAMRGINDHRGKLFFEFIRILKDKQPKFFLAENVSGILLARHKEAVENIIQEFEKAGYKVKIKLLNAHDYGVPQDRKRVFFVGLRRDINTEFIFPEASPKKKYLKKAIGDLPEAISSQNNKAVANLDVSNHEYMTGGFSTIYMSRNRVRAWDEPSFTIQAGGRHAPLHPKAPKMKFIEQNKRIFVPGKENLYRRLSLRECARVQTFPDDFVFYYSSLADGYKMVGNAVPVQLAYAMARSVMDSLKTAKTENVSRQKKNPISEYSLQPA